MVKQKVKQAVSFISDFESELCAVARTERCDGVICGHIHQPADKIIDGIHYLNSGDWVETMSAAVETINGEWKIVYYSEWAKLNGETALLDEIDLLISDEAENILVADYGKSVTQV
jgi:hypothetical protein